jgi:nucleoid-associated protein YgaU
MVAIAVPQPQPAEWSPAPVAAPAPPRPAGRPERGRPVVPAPRRLPDRATRVRRRRLAVLVVGVVVAVAVVALGRVVGPLVTSPADTSPAPAGSGGPVPVDGGVYVVQPGDTLWTIATEVAPSRDPRPVVDRLRAVNGGTELDVGDRLVIDVD